jgi:hypothetical protein
MARIPVYTALVLSLLLPTSVFAAWSALPAGPSDSIELLVKSSGMDLLDRLETLLRHEELPPEEPSVFGSVIRASTSEARLAREFDFFLSHAFNALAEDPSEGRIQWAVDQLLFIFIKHVGAEAVGEKKDAFMDVIRKFVTPRHKRLPGSCVALLDPHKASTIH